MLFGGSAITCGYNSSNYKAIYSRHFRYKKNVKNNRIIFHKNSFKCNRFLCYALTNGSNLVEWLVMVSNSEISKLL